MRALSELTTYLLACLMGCSSTPPEPTLDAAIEPAAIEPGLDRDLLRTGDVVHEHHGSKALVLVLHSYGSSGDVAMGKLRLPYVMYPARLHDGVVVLAPTGALNEWASGPSSCCPGGDGGTSAELAAMVEARIADGDIDPDRVEVWGSSNGGFMAWRLVCERPDLFAVAVISSGAANGSVDPPCAIGSPVAILHVHGALDTTVGYTTGGPLLMPPATYPATTGPGGSLEQEGAMAGCSGELVHTGQVPVVLNADKDVLQWSGGCTHGYAEHWRFNAGRHGLAYSTDWSTAVLEWGEAHRRRATP